MEEADRILINSLISIGLEVSDENINLEDFSPNILINATSLCLEYIFESRNEHQSFPKSCPDNMASRYKVGQTLSEAIKSLGYKDAIGYQSFLYPNVKDSRKIISFLIENLPKESGPSVDEGLDEASKIKTIIKAAFGENWKSPWLPYYCLTDKFASNNLTNKCLLIPFSSDKKQLNGLTDWFESFPSITTQVSDFGELFALAHNYELKHETLDKIDCQSLIERIKQINSDYYEKESKEMMSQSFMQKPEVRKRSKFMNKNDSKTDQINEEISDKEKAIEEAEMEFEKLQSSYEASVNNYNRLVDKLEKLSAKYDSLVQAEQDLNGEIKMKREEFALKERLEIVLLHGESSVDKLQAAISKRESQIASMERQWRDHRAEILEKIEDARSKQMDKCRVTREIERQLEEVRGDMQDCQRDYQEKGGEIRVLDEKVKQIIKSNAVKQNRNEFTKRILELTENKKKQNLEIKKILADIFVLQKEINSLRGKLERSFYETSDCIYEFSKKDEMSKKMHKVLLGIHENCSNLVEIIEEKGRLLREIRDLETTIENENRENIEKNLERIQLDYEEAKQNCANLKRAIKEHKIKLAPLN